MQAVIMAGGTGSRLRHFTERLPKPLLKVGRLRVIERLIDNLQNAGVDSLIISVAYMADEIMRVVRQWVYNRGVDVTWYDEGDRPLGTIGALAMVAAELEDVFYIANADIVTRVDFTRLAEHHVDEKAVLTIAAMEETSGSRFGILQVKNDMVVGIAEKPVFQRFVNMGLYVAQKTIVQYIDEMTETGMDSVITKLCADKQKVAYYLTSAYWRDIGTMRSLSEAREDYANE